LPVFCGNHVPACRAGDCSATRPRKIWLVSGPLSCLAHAPALAHLLWTAHWSTRSI
jgi:hypothetical protein